MNGEDLAVLASALQTSSESGALLLLGRLLHSLPIPVLLVECGPDLPVRYGNAALHARLGAGDAPVAGRSLEQLFGGPGPNPLVPLLRRACETGMPEHHRDFEWSAVPGAAAGTWDWEAYPIGGDQAPGYLLVIALEIFDRTPPDPGRRQQTVDDREKASGILRIFGVAPDPDSEDPGEKLTARELEVAELVALGLSNSEISRRLLVSRLTVATHVAAILHKRHFRSRVQIAAWVVGNRLRGDAPGGAGPSQDAGDPG